MDAPRPRSDDPPRPPWKAALLVAALLGGQAALVWGAGIDPAAVLGGLMARHGALAAMLFVPMGALLCSLGMPRQAAAYAGGLAFGPWAGMALGLGAQVLGCMVSFAWARWVARDWVQGRIGGRVARADRFLAAHPFTATVLLRLLPLGNSLLLTLLAGVSGVAAAPFLLGSAVGYIPQTAIFALLGAGAGLGDGMLLALGAGLLLASAALALALRRRVRGLA